MSEAARTEAVVLRTMKYRDTSLIVTLYTRHFGKVSGIVKGARQPKSRFGSALQPMAHLQTMIYRKEGRDLQTVGQCDVIDDFRHIQEALPKMAVGMKMIELVQMISHEEENEPLFALLVASLTALDRAPGAFSNLFAWFEVRLASVLGFEPTFHACISCGRKKSPSGPEGTRLRFHLERGGILCESCTAVAGEKLTVRRTTVDLFDEIARTPEPGAVLAVREALQEERTEIESLLWAYLSHHVAGVRPLKSERVFAKIIPDA